MKKYVICAVLCFTIIVTSNFANASMTITTDTVSGSGAINLNPTSRAVTVNGGLFTKAAAAHAISGTTVADETASIVGVGTSFLSDVHPGDRLYLSSDTSNIGTVTKVTDDTHLELDSEWWGDELGNGTTQTITIKPASFQFSDSNGVPMIIGDSEGHIAIGNRPLFGLSGAPVVTNSGSAIFVLQSFDSTTDTGLNFHFGVPSTDSQDRFALYGISTQLQYDGTGALGTLYGNFVSPSVSGTAPGLVYAQWAGVSATSGSIVPSASAFYAGQPGVFSGGGFTNYFQFYGGDMTGLATNGYFLWYDSPGVYRVKSDGVMAYYNPAFTKYTPGASNYERVVQQWNSSVAQYGTENQGTGQPRALAFMTASTTRMTIGANGNIGIGVTSPTTALQVATSTANATSTLTVGKASQNKGTCLEVYDVTGTVQYITVQGGALVVSAVSCK